MLDVRRLVPVFVALGLQFGGVTASTRGEEALARLLVMASYPPLLAGLFLNRRWWAFRIIAAGSLLNLAVISANGGLMPVSPQALDQAGLARYRLEIDEGQVVKHSKAVLLLRRDTHLEFLADRYVIAHPVRKVVSMGDMVIAAGIAAMPFELALFARRPFDRPGTSEALKTRSSSSGPG